MLQVTADPLDVVLVTLGFNAGGMNPNPAIPVEEF